MALLLDLARIHLWYTALYTLVIFLLMSMLRKWRGGEGDRGGREEGVREGIYSVACTVSTHAVCSFLKHLEILSISGA